ncbi:uncharacterized protein J7T54_005463 [Emericellopsis cladophorae]|uniref:Uncharacterized protein n=1 Tax=Emericellopsis cladophorae TaxID=2686198 RepID=A0A9P9XZ84_9HYPO|nr:uncharacterized protein J7T54_005463 [Emericellopsis cladophorae]KAI6780361.1 hypothetical protein J7T54_005463 [Emericellopsis cladophorae]
MASRAVIPRFLLPLQGPLWRGLRIPLSQSLIIRFATTDAKGKDKDKQIVLEKPLKFNPPSHGSRLKKNTLPKYYGAQLTDAELAAQRVKSYPGMMAPEGTWAHWFWHSKTLHLCITMVSLAALIYHIDESDHIQGTLLSMCIFTFFMDYVMNSPFKDLLPPISDLFKHPINFFYGWWDVIVMHERDKSIKARESRDQHQADVHKRRYFMKMHGIEPKNPITMVFGKDEKEMSEEELEAKALGKELPETPQTEGETPAGRKKLLGLF